jgi:hypothetical protein
MRKMKISVTVMCTLAYSAEGILLNTEYDAAADYMWGIFHSL